MPQLLPETFLNNTNPLVLVRSKSAVYAAVGMVLLAVVRAAVATFFIKIDVSFKRGLQRWVVEPTEASPARE